MIESYRALPSRQLAVDRAAAYLQPSEVPQYVAAWRERNPLYECRFYLLDSCRSCSSLTTTIGSSTIGCGLARTEPATRMPLSRFCLFLPTQQKLYNWYYLFRFMRIYDFAAHSCQPHWLPRLMKHFNECRILSFSLIKFV